MRLTSRRQHVNEQETRGNRCTFSICTTRVVSIAIVIQFLLTAFVLNRQLYLRSDSHWRLSEFLGDKAVRSVLESSVASLPSSIAEGSVHVRLGQIHRAYKSLGSPEIHATTNISSATLELEKKVANVFAGVRGEGESIVLRSCFRYDSESGDNFDSRRVFWRDECHGKPVGNTKTLIAFNPRRTQRSVCGVKLPALKAVRFDPEKCGLARSINLLFRPPSIFNPDENRTIYVSSKENLKKSRASPTRSVPCDIPCIYPLGTMGIVSTRKIAGTKWSIIHSMEGAHYYENVRVHPEARLRDVYYSTYSFKSDIPLPYFSWDEYNIKGEPVDYNKAIRGASFLARNCGSKSKREDWVTGLQKYFRVDSLSSCLHNAQPPNGVSIGNKMMLMRQYLFHLAFENGIEEDYITEKLWGSLSAGTVPVYFGSPNVKDHVPEGSIISVHDFSSYQALGEYLTKVAANRTLYEQYHKWRGTEYPEKFVKKYNFTHIHSECRTCRWAYAKKYGLAWDHDSQSIVQPMLPPRMCFNVDTGLAFLPFNEKWFSGTHSIRSGKFPSKKCNRGGVNETLTLSVGQYIIHRSFFEHDNAIDVIMRIERSGTGTALPLFLSLATVIENQGKYAYGSRYDENSGNVPWFGASISNKTQTEARYILLQDRNTRLTVFTDWSTKIGSVQSGSVQILVYDGSNTIAEREIVLRRIRVVLESQNKFLYNRTSAKQTYFSKIAEDDFHSPLEFFYVENNS